jgi:uncharacterized protein
MKFRVLNALSHTKTFAIILDQDDEVLQQLQSFADQEKVAASSFAAIGAFSDAVLGWFDWDKKDYKRIPLRQQVEVLSLLGDITLDAAKRKVHAHVVLGDSAGHAHGGHLLEAHVRPTLEIFLQETPTDLRRAFDPRSHIALIKPNT